MKIAAQLTTNIKKWLSLLLAGLPLLATAQASAGFFTMTGPLGTARNYHTATLLPTGNVLVAGGYNGTNALASAEVYNPATGVWTATGSLITPRQWHTAVLLPNGEVLVAGGYDGTNLLASAEVYDPATGTWTATGSLTNARQQGTATVLFNGQVLVAGGDAAGTTAELYNPTAGTWSMTGSMTNGRSQHTATLLTNGLVLVAGGSGSSGILASAELYNPTNGIWTQTGALATGRRWHTATLLPNGQVLVAGGRGSSGTPSTVELYDPVAGTWSTATGTLITPCYYHTATLLPNGNVMEAGGYSLTSGALASAELFNPASETWTATSNSLSTARWADTATILPSGVVLIAGGYNNGTTSYVASAELYYGGAGFSASWQPQITNATSPLSLGSGLVLAGSGFRGISEASGGGFQSSATDFPVVQLSNVVSGLTMFLPSVNWSANSFTSAPVLAFSTGSAMVTLFANGIPSSAVAISVVKGATTVTLGNLSQTYTGGAITVTATTTPPGLTVNLIYKGSPVAPTNAGSYTVIGTINDPNYYGSATNTLIISQAPATVTLGNLTQSYTGGPITVTATTTPPGLTVNLTYNGSPAAPTNAGSYTVIGTINDPNCYGSATNTLIISQAETNIVANGGFETGDFTDWTLSGNTSWELVTTSSPYVHSGMYGAELGPGLSLGYLSQTVPTVPGQSYLLSFWLYVSIDSTPNEFLVSWNGTNIFDEVNMPGSDAWTNLQFICTAAAFNSVLQFGFRNDPSNFGLDDITAMPYDITTVPSLVVTTTNDSGAGSLRAAIANADFAGGLITFSNVSGAIVLTNGELFIEANVAILGPGPTNLAISGYSSNRVFEVNSHANDALISGLSIINGKSLSQGGGLYNWGTLTLSNCWVSGNETLPGNGGGIYNSGSITMSQCVISGNAAGPNTATDYETDINGGGVYNDGIASLDSCTVSYNSAGYFWYNGAGNGGSGGGIYSSPGSTTSLSRSTIYGNSAGDGVGSSANGDSAANGGFGGGVYSFGFFLITNCSIVGNRSGAGASGTLDLYYTEIPPVPGGNGGEGGGVYSGGSLQMYACTVSGNVCGSGGQGGNDMYDSFYNEGGLGGGGGGISCGSAVILGCTIANNATGGGGDASFAAFQGWPWPVSGVSGGSAGNGGGILSYGRLVVTNCTFANNTCGNGGAGDSGYAGGMGGNGGSGGSGGAIQNLYSLSLCNVTIAFNTAGTGGAGGAGNYDGGFPSPPGLTGGAGAGGGISGGATLLNTLVSGDSATGSGPDVSGAFTSLGYNLISTTNGSSGFGVTGDLLGVNPDLESLSTNGGPTLTCALLYGSPAIGAGSNIGAPATDQRGVTRPQGSRVDIGAYEYIPGTAVVFLGNLNQVYTGSAVNVTVSTAPPGLTVNLTYNGSPAAPTNAGSYTVVGIVSDPYFIGGATNTLAINQASATVTLGNLLQTYTGSGISVKASTTPPGLMVNLTYNGSPIAPTNPGNYTVVGTISDQNYYGNATSTLVITILPGTRYVWSGSPSPTGPFTNWQTAAHTIQDAVDVATAGDTVVVTNGLYAAGGRVVYGAMTNRVAINKPIQVQSVNGPQVTIIQGYQVPGTTNGDGAFRCVYLTNGAKLSGFTLANGATRAGGDEYQEQSGGGVWSASASALITNCLLIGNSAYYDGGGAYSGTLNNCTLTGNSAYYDGGGDYDGTLNNCALTGNSADYGGGVYDVSPNNCTLTGNSAVVSGGGAYGSTLRNCIVYYNTGPDGNYDSGSSFNYCCTTPLPTVGVGNIAAAPQLASASHISATSPCRGAGNAAYTTGVDIDGDPWLNPPSIGCDEYHNGSVTGLVTVVISTAWTNVVPGFMLNLNAVISGPVSVSVWNFGDGTIVSNQPYASHAWSTPGSYPVVLTAYNDSNPGGISATVTVSVVAQPVVYVSAANPYPVPPYSSWAAAATNIQDAVDATMVAGALVLVSNGVYGAGGRAVYGALTNRVAVTKPITVQSVNGPQATVIIGDGTVRCVYLVEGAVLSGFTLTNGAARAAGDEYQEQSGGGVWCASASALITNCLLTGNSAYYDGGGAYFGTLNNCTLTGNSADYGGGASSGILDNCTLTGNSAYDDGGGSYYGTLTKCTLNGNSADEGGGSYYGTLTNCTLTDNSAYDDGGGSYYGTLTNCTLTDNSAYDDGGGAYYGTLANCTLNGNSAYYGGGAYSGTLNNCTLTGNSADYGGGASSGILDNCMLTGNSAYYDGGGAYYGTLNNCTLNGNSADYGGGDYDGTLNNCALKGNSADYGGGVYDVYLNNCTLTGNSAVVSGGGAYGSTLRNCIVYYNSGPDGNYDSGSSFNYCCTTPLPTVGVANIAAAPQLAGAFYISASSPCRGAGNAAYTTGVDIDGDPWLNPPSIGCDEYHNGSVTGLVTVVISTAWTNVVPGFMLNLNAVISGPVSVSVWNFGDGTIVSNQPYASHAWSTPGSYPVVLTAYNDSNPGGISATVTVSVVAQPVVYVSAANPYPVPPYSSWAAAATNIQDAVDATMVAGALVLVSNGVYGAGGRAVYGALTNRVAVTKPITVQSVNGPQATVIIGDGTVRCVYLVEGAVLSGFTLTNGAARAAGDEYQEQSGGGVWCASASALITNCLLTGNSAYYDGGGAYFGTLNNCTLTGNSADYGGGASFGMLNNCTLNGNSADYGGGASSGILDNCTLTGNSAYEDGGGSYYGTLTNCTLNGNSADYGGGASSGILDNCTLTGNSAYDDGGGSYYGTLANSTLNSNSADYGGGDYYGTLANCTLSGNSAAYGGGDYDGTLNNCALTGNSADYGGGVYDVSLNNCTLTGNSAIVSGGGAYGSTLRNCIVYYNTGPDGNYDSGSSFNYCCTTPLPTVGVANIAAAPQLAGAFYISASSPCRGAGNAAYTTGVDIDGDPWLNPPSIGCDEYHNGSVTGLVTVVISTAWTNVVPGFMLNLNAVISGPVSVSVWNFGDGTIVSNQPYASHAWSTPGSYPVVLTAYNDSNPGGISATVTVSVVAQPVVYVSAANPYPVAPFSSWATAATNIQDAVDAAIPGALVLVTNGVYANGGRVVYGAMTNRVAITRPIIVQSVNGPQATFIQGNQVPGTTNGDGAFRCVYLTDGATLSGFTLTTGATRAAGDEYREQSGGGVWCASTNAIVTSCVLANNTAVSSGGGAFEGTLNNCTLTGNSADYGGGTTFCTLNNCLLTGNFAYDGGGADGGTLTRCTLTGNSADYGGGASSGILDNCTLTGNSAYDDGGGSYYGTLANSTLNSNSADYGGGDYYGTLANCTLSGNSAAYGGGDYDGTLNNCALTGNSADYGGGVYDVSLNNCTLTGNSAIVSGGGAYGSTLRNCIVYYNTGPDGNYDSGSSFNYCCTTPLPTVGVANIAAAPQLAGAFYISASSPCRGAGNAAYTTGVDIDGDPWLNPPSIGCDEYHNGSVTGLVTVVISTAWTNVVPGFMLNLNAVISGPVSVSVWNFGDGTIVSNQPYASHAWSTPGSYPVVLTAYNDSNPGGISATVTVSVVAQPVVYVSAANPYPVPPYSSWAAAATNIQDAVDATMVAGALVLVSNGVYGAGGRAVYGALTNRVAVTKPITVQSVNGPQATVIIGDGTVRCVYLVEGAVLSGFTLTNGAARAAGDEYQEQSGGGVWCASTNAIVTSCVLANNTAASSGGGAFEGTLNNCTLTGNSADYGGGTTFCTLNNCLLSGNFAYDDGGGAYFGTLTNCTLAGNSAIVSGGGAYSGTLNYCTLTDNSATENQGELQLPGVAYGTGGGAYGSTLNNCTLAGNWAYSGGGASYGSLNNCTLINNWVTATYEDAPGIGYGSGGGTSFCTLNNCTLTGNSASGPWASGGGAYSGTLNKCTLTGNSASTGNSPLYYYTSGGGAAFGTLIECILTGNSATYGGGAYGGTLNNCALTGNSATDGGGAEDGTLTYCTLNGNSAAYGGGAEGGTLTYCTLNSNSAAYGGGASSGMLNNCLLTGNSATDGGGAYGGTLKNCTLTSNSVIFSGGGAYVSTLLNCIVYYNTGPDGNYDSGSSFNYCCTMPLPANTNSLGDITSAPMFRDAADGNYRLSPISPCIDAGQNQAWMFNGTDLDGNPRIINAVVDMGAYEFVMTLNLHVWLQGPYSTSLQAMQATNPGYVPLTSPYADDPRQVSVIPTNVVDWVLVQLRDTNGTAIFSQSGFLNTQGQLVSAGGSNGITAQVSPGFSYSIVVKHRNHLAVMSAQPVAFTNYTVSYDFTTGANQYSGGSNAAVQLQPGVWGMIAGDADGNGVIQMVDWLICSNQLGQTGYNRGDFNLDGVVDANDLALCQANLGLSTAVTNGGGTPLTYMLTVSPIKQTVLAGNSVTLTASGTSNWVNWAFASDASGGTLMSQMANTALYTAGSESNSVDMVEAWAGNLLGQSSLNVISAAEEAKVGKAIIIAGQDDTADQLAPWIAYLGNYAYNTLVYRGFATNNIQYLTNLYEGQFEALALPTTFANAALAFTNWAMNNPAQLFVYLVDHGGLSSDGSDEGYFYLNPFEHFTATDLSQWLDAIQSRYGIDVVVVLDFCYSGSFVAPLAYSGSGNRIVISSCASNEPTEFEDQGLVSFSEAFFSAILTGQDLAGAFSQAQSEATNLSQHAQFYANAGAQAAGTNVVGASFIAGEDAPDIEHVLGNQLLSGTTTVTLWAEVDSAYSLAQVWCMVSNPTTSTNMQLLELTNNPVTGRYEGQYSGFSVSGTYELQYYAQDVWGSVSLPVQSYVTQNGFVEKVILAAGGDTNAADWPAIDSVARQAYNTFLNRQLPPQAIYYVSPVGYEDPAGIGSNAVAGSSVTNLSYAITNWALGADQLTLYLLGEGTNGMFMLNPNETMAATNFEDWLDIYQASNAVAQVIMDFSGSGGFLPVLTAPPGAAQIAVASSQTNGTSLFKNGGDLSFSQYFLNEVFNGASIGQAFSYAQPAIQSQSGKVRQIASLDGATAAKTAYIGVAFLRGSEPPTIGTPMTNAIIALNTNLVLWAQDVTAMTGISNVWCLVTPPDYDGSTDLPQVNLAWNAGTSRYEEVYTNFTEPGTYVCTFYACDNLGLAAAAVQTEVVTLNPNLSPLSVSASVGANGVFDVVYQGYAGNGYAFEESTNLVAWLPLLTNTVSANGLLGFTVTNPPAKTKAFYRARLIQ